MGVSYISRVTSFPAIGLHGFSKPFANRSGLGLNLSAVVRVGVSSAPLGLKLAPAVVGRPPAPLFLRSVCPCRPAFRLRLSVFMLRNFVLFTPDGVPAVADGGFVNLS